MVCRCVAQANPQTLNTTSLPRTLCWLKSAPNSSCYDVGCLVSIIFFFPESFFSDLNSPFMKAQGLALSSVCLYKPTPWTQNSVEDHSLVLSCQTQTLKRFGIWMFFCPAQQAPDWDNILRVMKYYWKEAQEHCALVPHVALIIDSPESFSYLLLNFFSCNFFHSVRFSSNEF